MSSVSPTAIDPRKSCRVVACDDLTREAGASPDPTPSRRALFRLIRRSVVLVLTTWLTALPAHAQRRSREQKVDLSAAVAESKLPVTEFRAPLSDDFRRIAGEGQPSAVTAARCLVATPPDFDPAHPRPILVVNATTDRGYNSSGRLLLKFCQPALDAGWIVLSADPAEEIAPEDDSVSLRYGLLLAALDHLRHQWPGMTRWPRAYGGFSGGAKISGYLAGIMAEAGQPPCGVYLAGCNEDSLSRSLQTLKLPAEPFTLTPVFLSSGTEDKIATPLDHSHLKRSLLKSGFKHVELKSFVGRHEVNPEHITEALRWFAETSRLTSAATPKP